MKKKVIYEVVEGEEKICKGCCFISCIGGSCQEMCDMIGLSCDDKTIIVAEVE